MGNVMILSHFLQFDMILEMTLMAHHARKRQTQILGRPLYYEWGRRIQKAGYQELPKSFVARQSNTRMQLPSHKQFARMISQPARGPCGMITGMAIIFKSW